MTQLDSLMRAVLAELELLAAPRAGQMHYGSKGESDKAGPPFVPDRVGYWRRRYESLDNDEARKACIRGVLDEIRAVKYSRRLSVDPRTREGRLHVVRESVERGVNHVVYTYGYSRRQVYRLRQEARELGWDGEVA